MSKNYSGALRIGYSDTISSTITWLSGKIGAESAINPDNTPTDDTTGTVYGGSSANPEVVLLDSSDYDALDTLMQADTEKFWHVEYIDGRVMRTHIAVNPMVNDPLNMNARDGVSPITLSWTKFAIRPIFEETP